jgi:hypothetical protein
MQTMNHTISYTPIDARRMLVISAAMQTTDADLLEVVYLILEKSREQKQK